MASLSPTTKHIQAQLYGDHATCANKCGRYMCPNVALNRCSRCRHTFYCSREHQRIDWQHGHQYTCDVFGTTHTFDYALVAELLRIAVGESNLPVVSVGSGNGCVEARLMEPYPRAIDDKKMDTANAAMAAEVTTAEMSKTSGVDGGISSTPHLDIICVDPAPESFASYPVRGSGVPFMKPTFAKVVDLIAARPNVVGRCVLFLHWADPELEYDREAVQLLKPTNVVVLYEATGCAGGADFHAWLDTLSASSSSSVGPCASTESTTQLNATSSTNASQSIVHDSTPSDDDVMSYEVVTKYTHERKASKTQRVYPALALLRRVAYHK